MAKKNVLAVCGAGIATSSVMMLKVKELAESRKLDVAITKCQVGEYESKVKSQHFDLIISTTRVSDLGSPVLDGKPFLTGAGIENLERKIVTILST
jgi:galactitol PTS system EIIB component